MGLTKDSMVRGAEFDGVTGLRSGEQFEDLVTRASPAVDSEMVDQDTLETYLDEILSIYRFRVKDGSITGEKLADGSITNDKLHGSFTMIKSVQKGQVSVVLTGTKNTDIPITAVDPLKSFLIIDKDYADYSRSALLNATTVRVESWDGAGRTVTINWQVVEFI